MASSTQPLFIVGTGRSGTRTFFRMLSGTPGLEIHHEYDVLRTQRIACLKAMGLIQPTDVYSHLSSSHSLSVAYTAAAFWCDSSNKLSWIIPELGQLFPAARFLCLVRDGRKVVSSYYYKLREEMYDDRSTAIMMRWVESSCEKTEPPLEKKYWWAIPPVGSPEYHAFRQYNRLQRVAWHWHSCNQTICTAMTALAPERAMLVRLEDVCRDETLLERVVSFLGLPFDSTFVEFLQTPRNVFIPIDFQLTQSQLADFWEICGGTMSLLGYTDRKSYDVRY